MPFRRLRANRVIPSITLSMTTPLEVTGGAAQKKLAHSRLPCDTTYMSNKTTVEIVSDVICPWCFVGKRRYEKALASINFADHLETIWRPFQLNPNMPKTGISREEYRTKKFGAAEAQKMDAQMSEVGRELGIEFNFPAMQKTPNTMKAHRLIWWAQQNGVQDQVVESLFKAYFIEGRDIGDRSVLFELAADAGLIGNAAVLFVDGSQGLPEVQEEEARMRALGAVGVPAFVINGKLLMKGAQDPAIIVRALSDSVAAKAKAR